MKKIAICLMVITMTLFNFETVNATEFWAKNYIVMEQSTLQVLEGKDVHETQSVASISKIMSAIVVLENSDLERIVTIGEEINRAYGSGIYIHIGDEISIQDLLYGLMLRSGNDAALALSYHVGGEDIENFVSMMNQKAKELNMENTVFSNPSGLDEEDAGNISSVYDMALLMSYCLNNDSFREITSTTNYKRVDGKGTWKNKNKLLTQYDYTTSGKTGFTKKAKRTLVSSAMKDNIELVIVTFNCGDDFAMHKSLYEQYFTLYDKVLLLNRGLHQVYDYAFEVDESVFYPMHTDNQVDSYLSYEINEDDAFVDIYLNIASNKIHIGQYQLKEKKVNWIRKIINGDKI